jgi:threonine synthase
LAHFYLKCLECGVEYDASERGLRCPRCDGQLEVRYYYEALKEQAARLFDDTISTLWKYGALLPLADKRWIISLGEGGTRLLEEGWLDTGERVVLLATGLGFKGMVDLRQVVARPISCPPRLGALQRVVVEGD